jgi:hypothetical protein
MKLLPRRSLFFAVSFIFGCLPIWAASTLQVGSGCTSGCSGDPNFSGQHASSIDIWDSSGGQGGADPTLLFIGVPNVTNPNFFNSGLITSAFVSTAPGTAVTSQFGISPAAAAAYPSLKAPAVSPGYYGNFTAATNTDVYSMVGLKSNASQNFHNWSCVDLPSMPSCNDVLNYGQNFVSSIGGFGIYAFTINAAVPPKGYIQINLSSADAIPEGSYVIAYSGSLGVAFTNTGLQDVMTPEPVFRSLLAVGMVLMGLVMWTRKRVTHKA